MLSPAKDYCKQHIILHYVARILSPEVSVHAIGAVGRDSAGGELLQQMESAGIDTAFVKRLEQKPTMYSVCLQYPDKAICNVTTSQSASSLVSEIDIQTALDNLPFQVSGRTLVVAVPEVPVASRLELLRSAKALGAFCVSSFLLDEVGEFVGGGGVENTDLLAINEDEAAAYCQLKTDDFSKLAEASYEKLRKTNPGIMLAMTCGAQGSFIAAENKLRHIAAKPAKVVATGGAGDAYISGIICGLAMGLPFLGGNELSAPELGSSLAAEAISVPDTIAGHIDRDLFMGLINQGLKKGV
ncbi:MAG: PfkB family carbohydrate kinase [Eubacteriales bacterium]|nr:PfkB family carbohydrate kinase [Eubacteriales bacterium]